MPAIKYLAITDGSTTIRLDTIASGSMRADVAATAYSGDNVWGSDQMIVEPCRLALQGASTDAAATAFQSFMSLIRKAQNYRRTPWQTTPVYLKYALNETNYRYALVYDLANLQMPDLMNSYLEHGMIRDMPLSIVREHPWRSNIPGTLPTIITPTNTDGAAGKTAVFVSNAQEAYGISHAYTYKQATTAPVYDTSASTSGSSGNLTQAVTVGAHSNKALFIYVAALHTSVIPTVAVTVAGAAATLVKDFGVYGASAFSTSQLWQYIAPANGSNSVVATIGTNTGCAIEILSYYNVDQTNPIFSFQYLTPTTVGGFTNSIGGGAYTTTIDGILAYYSSAPTLTPDGAQTSRQNFQMGSLFTKMGASEKAGAGSVTMTWTVSNLTSPGVYWQLSISPVITWSADLVANASAQIIPSTPAVGDGLLVMGTSNGLNTGVVFPVGTAFAATSPTFAPEYSYTGNSFYGTPLVTGSYAAVLPTTATFSTLFTTIADYAVYWNTPAGWVSGAYNGQTGYAVRLRLSALSGSTVMPLLSSVMYAQSKPYVEIPSSTFVGDGRPILLIRNENPAGGTTSPVFSTASRIIIGAKSRNLGANQFINNFGLGYNGLTGWAITNGTDTTSISTGINVTSVNNIAASVSFATNTAVVNRVTLTGTAKAGFFFGRYRVFMRIYQVGGAAGDTTVQLRTQIGGSTTAYPAYVLPQYTSLSHDAGWELADLTGDSYLQIPFSQVVANDLSAQDLVFQIMAGRNTGTATLSMSDLILIPIEEWAVELRDPLSDTTNGTSALRGLTALDVDAGIMANRTIKLNNPSGQNYYPAETWIRGGDVGKLEPNAQYRFYFLLANYPVSWGVGPLVAAPNFGSKIYLYGHSTFQTLRGAT